MRENHRSEPKRQWRGELGKTAQKIALKLRALDLKRGKEEIHHLRSGKTAGKIPSEKELEFVRGNYSTAGNDELAEKLGCTLSRVQSLLRAAGIKRTKEEVNNIRRQLLLARHGHQKENGDESSNRS